MLFKKDVSVTPKSPKPIKMVESVLHFPPDQHGKDTTSSSPWISPGCSVQLASHVLLTAPETLKWGWRHWRNQIFNFIEFLFILFYT